jgi:hypothetical protein
VDSIAQSENFPFGDLDLKLREAFLWGRGPRLIELLLEWFLENSLFFFWMYSRSPLTMEYCRFDVEDCFRKLSPKFHDFFWELVLGII